MNIVTKKPHAVCIPYPAQSHIKAMLILAKLLHSQGIQITFINTEYNHKRFLKSGGPDFLVGLPDFQFLTIPDGLPVSDSDTTQDINALCKSIEVKFLSPFLELLEKINQVTCIVSDGFLTFTIDAGERYGIPVVLLWTVAACALTGYYHLPDLREKGYLPLKDTDGYMDTIIDWIPCMKGIHLKHFPSIKGSSDPEDIVFEFCMQAVIRSSKASAVIINTFDELEADVQSFLNSRIPQVYTIGPLQQLLNQIPKEEKLTNSIGYSLWKEEHSCLEWLDSRKPNSVIYVNFGSIAVLSSEKVMEFALGLCNSRQDFLWIIRPDLIKGESAILQSEFVEVIKERGFIASWCPQEEVLNHRSIKGFLTHCGWNSTIESLTAGVAMICLPLFGDQAMNCRYTCTEWGIGIELNGDFNKDDVERIIRALMEGEKGLELKNKAMEWKGKAQKATQTNGSSSLNFKMLVDKFFSHH